MLLEFYRAFAYIFSDYHTFVGDHHFVVGGCGSKTLAPGLNYWALLTSKTPDRTFWQGVQAVKQYLKKTQPEQFSESSYISDKRRKTKMNNEGLPYQLFSKCFYYPDEELTALLFEGEIIRIFQILCRTRGPEREPLREWVENYRCEDELLEALEVEYTRLFVTAFPTVLAPPYKSFYFEHEVYGNETGKILDLYHEHGFRISESIKEPADHLGVELEFLCRTSEVNASKAFQIDFIRKHLLSWLRAFQQRVDKHALLPFYPYMTHALMTFLAARAGKSNKSLTGVTQ